MVRTTIADGHTISRHPTVGHEAIEMKVADHRSSASDLTAASVHDLDLKARTKPKRQRLRARVQFATLCWAMYLAGWNDGTTGPLLPRIQKVYGVGDFDACSIV
jgi:hypothetical protein